MSTPLKEKVAEAMTHPNGDKTVGDKIAEKTERGCDVGINSLVHIHDHMNVISSCGTKVGVVDHVEGPAIMLTQKDSPDGKPHFIPAAWVDHVDDQVHLSRNSTETIRDWQNDAISCRCFSGF